MPLFHSTTCGNLPNSRLDSHTPSADIHLRMRFTHLINPFVAPVGTEHDIARRITMASMRDAVACATEAGIEVEVLAAVFPEDVAAVELPVRPLPSLTRSVLDLGRFEPPRKYPLAGDLMRLGAESGRGEYLVYSNIDIALQPYFYREVDRLIRQASPAPLACAINRRTIPGHYREIADLPRMRNEPGRKHPGWDCFVFPLAWAGAMQLGGSCIGVRHFDDLFIANIDLLSGFRFTVFRDLHLTFHIGDDRSWVSRIDYEEHNLREAWPVISRLRAENCIPPESIFEYLYKRLVQARTLRQRLIRRLKRSDLLVRWVRRMREGPPV